MQRYFANKIVNDRVELEQSDYHHIKNVMRMHNNDEIEVIYDKKLYIAKIINIDNFDIQIIKYLDDDNELDIDVTVAIGLVKEQKFDLILQKLTELGVSKIIPVKFSRSIVKLDDKIINKKLTRWVSICKEASEQSKRNRIPIISRPLSINELNDIDADIKLVASTKNEIDIINSYLDKTNYKSILVVIGPEGGISEEEEVKLNDNGFISVSFGKRVLRVETAAIYALSVINYSRM